MSLAELLPFALIGGVFWLLVMRPAKKRRDEHNRLMATLVPGARIMTTAGLFGTVVEVETKQVSVEIAPGVVVQMVSQAIANVIVPEDPPQDPLDALEADFAAESPVAADGTAAGSPAAGPTATDFPVEGGPVSPATSPTRADNPTTPTDRDGETEQGAARG